MIDLAAAHTIAQDWARAFHPDATVVLEPFELGYVARRTAPELADVVGPVFDAEVTVVVDGQTGALSRWPTVPVQAVAQMYRDRANAQARFSPELLGLLGLAGWRPGRDVGVVVDGWWWRCAPPDTVLPPPVRAVVAEFGGISLRPADLSMLPYPYDQPVEFIPAGDSSTVVVGYRGETALSVDDQGAVYLSTVDGPRRVADTFDAALIQLLGLAG
jgi:hypothetical protein